MEGLTLPWEQKGYVIDRIFVGWGCGSVRGGVEGEGTGIDMKNNLVLNLKKEKERKEIHGVLDG